MLAAGGAARARRATLARSGYPGEAHPTDTLPLNGTGCHALAHILGDGRGESERRLDWRLWSLPLLQDTAGVLIHQRDRRVVRGGVGRCTREMRPKEAASRRMPLTVARAALILHSSAGPVRMRSRLYAAEIVRSFFGRGTMPSGESIDHPMPVALECRGDRGVRPNQRQPVISRL